MVDLEATASTPEERSIRVIPGFRARLGELCTLADQVVGQVSFPDDDHFAFMAVCYCAKQGEHAMGILRLGVHPDASLIARSMLEGAWQLRWAQADPDERARRWRLFSIIYDWRVLQEKTAANVPVEPARRRRILSRLPEAHEHFLTATAKKRRAQGESLPKDPYEKTWSRRTARDFAESVGDLDSYLGLYDDFSDRHHWSPAGVGAGLRNEGGRFRYDARLPTTEAQSLSIAFECLLQTVAIVDEHLGRGFGDSLERVLAAFVADHHAAGAAANSEEIAPDRAEGSE